MPDLKQEDWPHAVSELKQEEWRHAVPDLKQEEWPTAMPDLEEEWPHIEEESDDDAVSMAFER